MPDDEPRFTDPVTAVDHVRRTAREAAAASGYRAAADAVMDLRREYRIMPLQKKDAPPDRLATWEAVRTEVRSLVPMAMGGTNEHALFDERVATPADEPLPQQPSWAPDRSVALQASALRAPALSKPSPSAATQRTGVDRTPAR